MAWVGGLFRNGNAKLYQPEIGKKLLFWMRSRAATMQATALHL
jgi:hypothetical protein